MDGFSAILIDVLALGVLIADVVLIALIVWGVVLQKQLPEEITKPLTQYGLWVAFLLALGATAGTLFFSEIVGLEPCKLCWFSRIFMYPLVVILGIAALRRDTRIADYGIVLSVGGIIISLWHYLLQMTGSSVFSCGADASASCAVRYMFEFGYITFPMMGLTTFALIIVVLSYVRRA